MKLLKNEVLVLRSVNKDMSSSYGFVWPKKGPVAAPDWKDTDKCGNGLHGLPWGVGGVEYCADAGSEGSLWLVVRVKAVKGNYQHGTGNMTDKCKFHKGVVVFCGTNKEAVAMISKYAPANLAINWSTQKAGDRATQTAGDWSTQTAGDEATQKAGANTVQIIHAWKDGEMKVFTRTITEKEAGKWYRFEGKRWRMCTEEEVKEADGKVGK